MIIDYDYINIRECSSKKEYCTHSGSFIASFVEGKGAAVTVGERGGHCWSTDGSVIAHHTHSAYFRWRGRGPADSVKARYASGSKR